MELKDILVERAATHGPFACVADTAIRLQDVSAPDNETVVGMFGRQMICAKLARIACGDAAFEDHWRDIAGYATLVADEIAKRSSGGG